jgi:hypothetical protein
LKLIKEYIHMILKLGLAEVATTHIKDEETLARLADISELGEKNMTRYLHKEKSLRLDQLGRRLASDHFCKPNL